jgi:putative endonuclease
VGVSHKEIGKRGEKLAVDYLRKNKYLILEQNYCCHLGEVDIIAKKGNTLIFCEVKTKASSKFGEPVEEVDDYKQEKLKRLANYYFAFKTRQNLQCRFDVISINLTTGGEAKVNHLKNAFS